MSIFHERKSYLAKHITMEIVDSNIQSKKCKIMKKSA